MEECDKCYFLEDEVERLSNVVETLEIAYESTKTPMDLFDFINTYPGIAEDFLDFIVQEYRVENQNSPEAVTWLQENHHKAYYYSKNYNENS